MPHSHPLRCHLAYSRARRILTSWRIWRASRHISLEHALEASALATMLCAWGVGYSLLNPAEPARHAVQHVAQVLR